MTRAVGNQSDGGEKSGAGSLYDCVIKGLKKSAEEFTLKELAEKDPMEIVNGVLIPALEEVGRLYDKGTFFLPQLISSAEAAKAASPIASAIAESIF